MINMTITTTAAEEINRIMDGRNLTIKLKYQTEGCGCVVSGVPTLELIEKDDLETDDIRVGSEDLPIYMEKSKLIFFNDELKIDYSTDAQAFRLVSPEQILNGRMSCKIVN